MAGEIEAELEVHVQHSHPLVMGFIRAERWAISADFAKTMLKVLKGEGNPAQAAVLRESKISKYPRAVETLDAGIAVIPVMGVIAPRAGMFQSICGPEMTSHEALMKDFAAAMESPDVKSIILLMDSPGGAVTGTSELAQMIYDARGKKQVTAFVRGSADSAAYWIASAAGEIVMSKTAEVGSIGVYAAFQGSSDEDTDIIIQSTQSPMKNVDPTTDEGRAAYQKFIDGLATTMIADIAAYRGTTSENVQENFGKGFVLQHDEAVPRGMADRVSTFETVVSEHIARNKKGPHMSGSAAPASAAAAPAAEAPAATSLTAEQSIQAERLRLQSIEALDIPAEFEAIRTDNKYKATETADTIGNKVFQAMQKKTRDTSAAGGSDARELAAAAARGGGAPAASGSDAEKTTKLATAFAAGANARRERIKKRGN